jgi:homoserine dehydrogenase
VLVLSSTAMVLKNNAAEIARRAGRKIEIIQASRRSVSAGLPAESGDIDLVGDPFEVVNNPAIDIVIELIGGYQPALDLVMQAIENGKHVVTANKALIALHGNEIFAAAQQQGVNVVFEAAVAGGIPIIKSIREGLSANHIESVAGIINGTGNFILTEMRDNPVIDSLRYPVAIRRSLYRGYKRYLNRGRGLCRPARLPHQASRCRATYR